MWSSLTREGISAIPLLSYTCHRRSEKSVQALQSQLMVNTDLNSRLAVLSLKLFEVGKKKSDNADIFSIVLQVSAVPTGTSFCSPEEKE